MPSWENNKPLLLCWWLGLISNNQNWFLGTNNSASYCSQKELCAISFIKTKIIFSETKGNWSKLYKTRQPIPFCASILFHSSSWKACCRTLQLNITFSMGALLLGRLFDDLEHLLGNCPGHNHLFFFSSLYPVVWNSALSSRVCLIAGADTNLLPKDNFCFASSLFQRKYGEVLFLYGQKYCLGVLASIVDFCISLPYF